LVVFRPHLRESWRRQELSDTGLRLDHPDSPSYGRRYEIYHNQVRVGELEVSASHLDDNVIANTKLDWVRLLPISTIRALLRGLALHICDPDQTSEEYRQARVALDNCLTDTLWQAQRITEFDYQDYGGLELQLEGSAKWYFERRGSAGFAKWKEQRRVADPQPH
jgi:hypothetical protein